MDPDPGVRNADWFHLVADDVLSMPDKWEYPWFAAWDLAFHAIPLALVDIGFAKQQIDLLLRRLYQHPNGQLPAYEWNFTDVNPPVHAWATYFVYQLEKGRTGEGDLAWLETAFQKLVKNFTWWVNRKDPDGRNVFQGGFLGLDNIGVFDRSAPLPTGGHLDQADGTAWMALYARSCSRSRSSCPARRPGLPGAGRDLLRALRLDRRGDEPRRLAAAPGCGTRRTASSTTCCGCPTARPCRSRSGRWSGCCRSRPPP